MARRWFFFLLFVLSVAGPAWIAWQRLVGWFAPSLPVLGELPSEFALVDQAGRPVTARDLRGQVWVANFIFTRCRGICPALTAHMRGLVNACGNSNGVLFVSISVDPAHDTPETLAQYAREHGATSGRWRFVTGDREQVIELIRQGFRLGVESSDDPSEPIVHSNRFALVDRRLRLRAYHQPLDSDFVQRVCADLAKLIAEREGREAANQE